MKVYLLHGDGQATRPPIERLRPKVEQAGCEAVVGEPAARDWQKSLELKAEWSEIACPLLVQAATVLAAEL